MSPNHNLMNQLKDRIDEVWFELYKEFADTHGLDQAEVEIRELAKYTKLQPLSTTNADLLAWRLRYLMDED